jgi:sporulation protein YlmC with PRC-barrel domain
VTAPIEDISSLPGKKVSDQQGTSIGKVKQIYAIDGDGQPMWVELEGSFGSEGKRNVLIPIARLKDEDGEIGVPYSKDRIGEAPEVDTSDGVSAESDRELRGYYGIGIGDQELWQDNKSYATLVPEQPAEAKAVDDAGQLETPDPDKRTDETMERLQDSQRRDSRSVSELTGEDDDDTDDTDKDDTDKDDTDKDDTDKDDTDKDDTDDDDTDAGEHKES